MANHKSAKKRIRATNAKRVLNKYQHKTVRNAIKVMRNTKDKAEAATKLPSLLSRIDKLAKKRVIHKNKAGNLKSSLMKHVNTL